MCQVELTKKGDGSISRVLLRNPLRDYAAVIYLVPTLPTASKQSTRGI
jgi:hypothetical protein